MTGAEAAPRAGAPTRAWRWLARRSPFFWITVSPLVTAPLGMLFLFFLGGEREAEALGLSAGELCRFQGNIAQTCLYYFDVWRTGLLLAAAGAPSLLAGLWLLRRNGYVRMAAALALALALARTLIVPAATIALSQFDVYDGDGLWFRVAVEAGGGPGDVEPPTATAATWRLLLAVWAGGTIFWVATVALWRAYEPLMARFWRTLTPPGGPRPGAPPRWTGFLRQR